MSHTSSDSSLLQRHRPVSLPPQPQSPTDSQILAQRLHLETHESRHLPETFIPTGRSRSRANSGSHSDLPSLYSSALPSPSFHLQQPIASTSSGMAYLNQDPTSSMSNDVAHPKFDTERCTSANLVAVRDGSIGHVIPRERWQPDCSSALCSQPFCSTIFSPSASYFSLGPRRHHCRKCGLLFCSSHSNNKALLYDADHNLVKERVCDMCIHKDSDEASLAPRSRRQSVSSLECRTDSSLSAEHIVTPSELSLSRTSTRMSATTPRTPGGSLAPVQGWMDKDGVLSLYPLALPSVSRQSAVPAARPLFAPSQAAIRIAKEKEEYVVYTLRQRRLGREREASWESERSRRGSMESVEEEAVEVPKRSNSRERIAQSSF